MRDEPEPVSNARMYAETAGVSGISVVDSSKIRTGDFRCLQSMERISDGWRG